MPSLRRFRGAKQTSLLKKAITHKLKGLSIPGMIPGKSPDVPPKHGRVFLGLDPSLRGFGSTAVTESGCLYYHDTFRDGAKSSGMTRIGMIVKYLTDIVLVYKHCRSTGLYKDLVVVREDYAYKANDAADTPLKELGGVIEWVLHKMGVRLYKLNITTIKKFVSGHGNTDKSDIPDIVYRRFGFSGDEDACHAFAAAITALALVNRDRIQGLDKAQQEVLAALTDHGLTSL